jgi:6-phosphofructokinase 1
METDLDLSIPRLGPGNIPSPMEGVQFIGEEEHVLYHSDLRVIQRYLDEGREPPRFEVAGPREKIYFDASKLKCGIVTCGGLCPGQNDVIRALVMSLYHHYRALVMSLYHHYGVRTIFGFRYGFEGLAPRYGHTPLELDPGVVREIHKMGGTILGTSRGPQDVSEMVDTLERMNVRLLFVIGGDGTLKGASALVDEIARRELKIGVVGVPKTIDNDISFVERSFGFETAVSESRTAIYSAHTEALGARNGIGLVKLMGRYSGFIAARASLANNDVNFCLVPEVPFDLYVFFEALKKRLNERSHALIVLGEGAGQEFMAASGEKDASGNVKLGDIGLFLRDKIKEYFQKNGMEVNLKYIDPSYTIRSVPANPGDSAYCLLLGHNAAHAGMSGRTNVLVGYWEHRFTHVPIPLAVSARKQIDPQGRLWADVLSCTGQPKVLV